MQEREKNEGKAGVDDGAHTMNLELGVTAGGGQLDDSSSYMPSSPISPPQRNSKSETYMAGWTCANPVTITVKDLIYAVPQKETIPGCEAKRCIPFRSTKAKSKVTQASVGEPDLSNVKVLLNKVNMIARPGEVLAIVGPSGGGKTTLLNVLAMRSPNSRIPYGHVNYNGRSETKATVRSTVNYVMAHDKLLPYLTVFETLEACAALKLPGLSKEARLSRVEEIIEDLDLQKCRNVLIGGEWRKGVSSGEVKRVSIGCELLDNPSVLILDEPTSGLDTVLSERIMVLLVNEARKGRTIITTIHQPSSQVFAKFDQFLLISQGQIIFHSAASEALTYFAKLGYTGAKDWNPSDFMLDLVSAHPSTDTDSNDEVTADPSGSSDRLSREPGVQKSFDSKKKSSSFSMSEQTTPLSVDRKMVDVEAPQPDRNHLSEAQRLRLAEDWSSSSQCAALRGEITQVELALAAREGDVTDKVGFCCGGKSKRGSPQSQISWKRWWFLVWTLWKRISLNSIRNPLTAIVAVLIQIMQGLVLGGIFYSLSFDVSAGPKPDSLLGPSFWENPWVQLYSDVPGRNEPMLEAFEQGLDRNGSYIVKDWRSKEGDWIAPIHHILHKTVSCLYDRQEIAYDYEPLDRTPWKRVSVDDWTPRQIYSDVMAGYQWFDAAYFQDRLPYAFINECKAKGGGRLGFYTCLLNDGAPTLDVLATCVGMPHIQNRFVPPTPPARRLSKSGEAFSGVPKYSEMAGDSTMSESTDKSASYSGFGRGRHDSQKLKSAPKRNLMSVSDIIDLDRSVREIVGDDFYQFYTASKTWADRVTGCSHDLCKQIKKIYDFMENWSASTVQTIAAVLNISGCLFFVVANLGFASYDALLTFPQERSLFNRESANGLYTPGVYYLAKNLADIPFQMVPSLVMATIFYFMVGLDVTAHQFFVYFAICILSSVCAYGFGYMVSAAAPRMEIAVLVAPLTLVLWLVLAGFFLRDADIPVWIDWFKYLSFYRWTFFSLVVNQFPPGGYYGTLPNSVHLKLCGVTETNLGVSLSVLVALGFTYRVLGYLFLAHANRRVGLEA